MKPQRGAVAMTADELRQIRAELGKVQAEMAPLLMVSLVQYKRYEKNGIPRAAMLRAKEARRLLKAKRNRGPRRT